jgi:hypothetical protein
VLITLYRNLSSELPIADSGLDQLGAIVNRSAMEWISLDAGDVSEHGSLGLYMTEAARVRGADEFRVHIAQLSPGGLLGRHPARLWQFFAVITGTGWVSGDDGIRHEICSGQGVRWSPGESHESGSDDGMLAVIVQANVPPQSGNWK